MGEWHGRDRSCVDVVMGTASRSCRHVLRMAAIGPGSPIATVGNAHGTAVGPEIALFRGNAHFSQEKAHFFGRGPDGLHASSYTARQVGQQTMNLIQTPS